VGVRELEGVYGGGGALMYSEIMDVAEELVRSRGKEDPLIELAVLVEREKWRRDFESSILRRRQSDETTRRFALRHVHEELSKNGEELSSRDEDEGGGLQGLYLKVGQGMWVHIGVDGRASLFKEGPDGSEQEGEGGEDQGQGQEGS
jgi:hypothetical protein